MATVEIMELASTWGCAWRLPGGKKQYGWRNIPASSGTKTWLGSVGGDVVKRLVKAGYGTITDTTPHSYGGQCNTIQVDTGVLDAACAEIWNRANAASRQRQATNSCHYCGMKATATGFFGEPVCSECN